MSPAVKIHFTVAQIQWAHQLRTGGLQSPTVSQTKNRASNWAARPDSQLELAGRMAVCSLVKSSTARAAKLFSSNVAAHVVPVVP